MKRFSWLLVLVLLAACNDEPAIVKKDDKPENPAKDPKIVEQESDEQESKEFIEFTLPDEEVLINLEMVPILDAYLQGVENRDQTIEDMDMQHINADNRNLYLLEFSCTDGLCSYLLLDRTNKNQTYLVADLAKSVSIKLSPDSSKILFHFNREQSELPASNIVVFHLDKWKSMPLANVTGEEDVLDYTWTVLTAKWADNDRIKATIPDMDSRSDEAIQQWENNGRLTKEVEFTLDTDN
ncbi:hypothetical protein [Lentibacillus juripiscarius]|uniref:Lipoprotein n=1 Tax=Lentibacillus juripiscarius TaxID=257446 RepID=A0ABW5V982_9BACI